MRLPFVPRATWRAAAVVWAAHARRARGRLVASRPRLVPVLLTILGLGGMLAGGALIGEWCLGLMMIAEGVGAVAFGLFRDDGTGHPPSPFDAPTVAQVLERARHAP
jgi:hypothetical protein